VKHLKILQCHHHLHPTLSCKYETSGSKRSVKLMPSFLFVKIFQSIKWSYWGDWCPFKFQRYQMKISMELYGYLYAYGTNQCQSKIGISLVKPMIREKGKNK